MRKSLEREILEAPKSSLECLLICDLKKSVSSVWFDCPPEQHQNTKNGPHGKIVLFIFSKIFFKTSVPKKAAIQAQLRQAVHHLRRVSMLMDSAEAQPEVEAPEQPRKFFLAPFGTI